MTESEFRNRVNAEARVAVALAQARYRNEQRKGRIVCRCAAYKFPHRWGSSEDCPRWGQPGCPDPHDPTKVSPRNNPNLYYNGGWRYRSDE